MSKSKPTDPETASGPEPGVTEPVPAPDPAHAPKLDASETRQAEIVLDTRSKRRGLLLVAMAGAALFVAAVVAIVLIVG